MTDPYSAPKQNKQRKQWKDMTPEEKRAWCLYFRGKGPKPPTK